MGRTVSIGRPDLALIYKILLPSEWEEFDKSGRFTGSPFDVSSGFVHCSSRTQVGTTALRFFADEPALIVVVLDAEMLSDQVRWEPAPNGDLFPHVYGACPRLAVVEVHRVAGAAFVDQVLGNRGP